MKMIEENKKNQEIALQKKEQMRLEDLAAQKAYIRMVEKQEQDRADEMAAREKRQLEFMNRMAGGVLKEMDNNAKREEEMIIRFQRERDQKLARDEDEKARRRAETQKKINETN
jgi:hypothetical protein